mmetsp:Transcript_79538/g.151039  ORF Transcript_79538/g.151039 Transcript_79538/m.151039 type:complete len:161 (-) Transcript_79538:183-665(-)
MRSTAGGEEQGAAFGPKAGDRGPAGERTPADLFAFVPVLAPGFAAGPSTGDAGDELGPKFGEVHPDAGGETADLLAAAVNSGSCSHCNGAPPSILGSTLPLLKGRPIKMPPDKRQHMDGNVDHEAVTVEECTPIENCSVCFVPYRSTVTASARRCATSTT